MWGRQTFAIVVSTPCMTQAQMMVAVVAARLGTGGAFSPVTARQFRNEGGQKGGGIATKPSSPKLYSLWRRIANRATAAPGAPAGLVSSAAYGITSRGWANRHAPTA